MIHLGFKFSATYCNGWPKLRFLVDDDIYHDFEFVGDSAFIELPIDLLDGSHIIDIEYYGKTYDNTVVINDKIIQDQLATLDSIHIDQIKVPDFIKYQGVYTVNETSTPSALTWGQNGVWSLSFEWPIIDWVLEKKLRAFFSDEQWATAVYHPTKTKLLLDNLNRLENILANVKL
jgi:hypothetical protein